MDEKSIDSTIVYQDQETQHIEEEKTNITEEDSLDKKLSKTEHSRKGSAIEYQDQQTQHIEEEKVNVKEDVNEDKNLSYIDRQSKGSSIELKNQEIQHIGKTNIAIDIVELESQQSNTDQPNKDSLIAFQDQETQLNEKDMDTNYARLEKKRSSNTGQEQKTQHQEEVTNIIVQENLENHQSCIAQQSKCNPISYQNEETQHARENVEKKSIKESISQLEILKEIAIKTIDLNIATCSTAPSLETSLISKKSCVFSAQPQNYKEYDPRLPVIVINSSTNRSPITIQPSRTFLTIQSSISPKSLITAVPNQPQSLFLQALARLNESSISLAILNKSLKSERTETENPDGATLRSPELTPPDSLTSAPPSYSFVLRQAARRRPRLMGTFIPSPSFVTKTPPPNYAAAFDIYVDSPLPPQPARIYHFGFSAMPIICPECGYAGLTAVTSKITLCTHLCALLLCLFCCWVCAPLPYIMSSCKDVYHYCRNCRNFLGMYSPSNPETPYPVG